MCGVRVGGGGVRVAAGLVWGGINSRVVPMPPVLLSLSSQSPLHHIKRFGVRVGPHEYLSRLRVWAGKSLYSFLPVRVIDIGGMLDTC